MDSSQLSLAAGISLGTTCKSGYPAHLCPTCPCKSGPLGRRIKWEHRGGSTSGSSSCQVLSSWDSRHMREACVLRAYLVIVKVLHLVITGCVFENSLLVYFITEWTLQSVFIPTITSGMSWSNRTLWIHHQTHSLYQTKMHYVVNGCPLDSVQTLPN